MPGYKTVDLWAQINDGQQLTAEEAEARVSDYPPVGKVYSPPEELVLGQTHQDAVFAFCGIKPKKIIWHQRNPEQFVGAENWPYAQVGDLSLFFDAEGRWHGLSWEPGLGPNSPVHWMALGEHQREEKDDVVAGRLRLLLNGGGMSSYVALPNLIAMLSGRGLRYSLDAMWYDKWLRLEAEGKTGTIAASFNLQALKAQYESRFEIDYFLTSVTILSKDYGTPRAEPIVA